MTQVARRPNNISLLTSEETNRDRDQIRTLTQEPTQVIELLPNSPVRRTMSLAEINETCNLVLMELESFEAAQKQEVWRQAVIGEIKMIEKNETWELVDHLQDKDTIGAKWDLQDKAQSRQINSKA